MTCDTCKEFAGFPVKTGWLEAQMVGGHLRIHTICETCLAKLEEFLQSLGWRLAADKPKANMHTSTHWRCHYCGELTPYGQGHGCTNVRPTGNVAEPWTGSGGAGGK